MAWGLISELLGSHPDGVVLFGYLASGDFNRTQVNLEDARRETTNHLIGHLPYGSVTGLSITAYICALRGPSVCFVGCAGPPSAVVSSEHPTLLTAKSSQNGNRRACLSPPCRSAWQCQAFSRAWARQAGLPGRFLVSVQQHVWLDR